MKENKFTSFARLTICIIMLFVMGSLTIASLTSTTGMEIVMPGEGIDNCVYRIKELDESVVYYSDSIIGNLIWLAVCAAVCVLIMPYLKRIPLWAELAAVGIWTLVIGIIWVNSSMSAPSEDSYIVTNASMQFANNDFSALGEDQRYFRNYSFQLGYVLFNELLIRAARLFGEPERMIFAEVINVILLALTNVGIVLINKRIFKDPRVHRMTAFLLLFALQPIIFSTFLYGIIPGLAFAVWSLFFMIMYFQSNKIYHGIFSALCIALSVTLKSNNNIVLVAIVCVTVVMLIQRKKFVKDLIYLFLSIVLSISLPKAVIASYESRANVDLGDSVPYISWFDMGLSESNMGPGWYNYSATITNFDENDHDAKKASKASREKLMNKVEFFIKNPQYRKDFFHKKFVSQWNETSYQSIWNSKVRRTYEDRGAIANWVCNDGEFAVKKYMDIYTQLIFVGVLVGLAFLLKNKNFLAVVFPLIVLGGILYHILAEAKSQYALPYFIYMIGFAAYGICSVYDRIPEKYRKIRLPRRKKTPVQESPEEKSEKVQASS